jgi:hypothetical protein
MPASQLICRFLRPRVVTPVSLRSLINSAFRGTELDDSGHLRVPAQIASSDPIQGNIEKMTGRTQGSRARTVELGAGEIEGITFKVEPLRRQGEDTITMRARLLCPSSLGTLLWFSGMPMSPGVQLAHLFDAHC